MIKKILVVSDAREYWGAEKSLEVLLEGVTECPGIDVSVLVHPRSPFLALATRFKIAAGPLAARRTRDNGGLRRGARFILVDLIVSLFGAVRIAGLVRRSDIVVCFGTWELMQVLPACLLARRPCVLDLHETFDGPMGNRVLRFLLRLTTGVIATSSSVVPGPALKDRLRVVPRPVRIPTQQECLVEENASSDKLNIVMAGQVVPHKRVLEAIQQVAHTDCSMTIVGMSATDAYSDYECDVACLAASVGSRIRLVPRTQTLNSYYAAADVVLNMSAHEAFGRTLVEGMSYGCWPVALDGGAPAEILADAGIGTIVQSVDDLSEAIMVRAQLSREQLRAERRLARAASERFQASTISKRYWTVVMDLAASNA